jgi:hypothetical protein
VRERVRERVRESEREEREKRERRERQHRIGKRKGKTKFERNLCGEFNRIKTGRAEISSVGEGEGGEVAPLVAVLLAGAANGVRVVLASFKGHPLLEFLLLGLETTRAVIFSVAVDNKEAKFGTVLVASVARDAVTREVVVGDRVVFNHPVLVKISVGLRHRYRHAPITLEPFECVSWR